MPRAAGLAVSLALHAGFFAAVAGLPTGASADAARPPERLLALAWTARTEIDPVPLVLPPRTAATSRAPEPVLEVIRTAEPEVEPVRTPEVVTSLVRDQPDAGATESPRSQPLPRDAFLSSRPGRGGGGMGAGIAGSIGVGSGGAGGLGGAGGPGAQGAATGCDRVSGGEGDGAGCTPRGGVTRAASVVGTPLPPAYPVKARSRGWEGRVVLDIAIDAEGRVTSVAVAETSGRAALDEAACNAACGWSFAPALLDGRPVAGSLRVPVRFELTD